MAVFKDLDSQSQRLPREALKIWKDFVNAISTGELMDNIKAQKLKSALQNIPVRTIKDANERIFGQGDKIKGRLMALENRLKQVPRDALRAWKQYVDAIKTGNLIDGMRAQQLQFKLAGIPHRTLKDAQQRVIGNGDKILGRLKELERNLQKIPREALRIWKNYIEKVKAGSLLDGIRAQQLKSLLSNIPFRVSKDAKERIIGNGNAVIGKLKELEKRLQNIPREALRNWKNYVEKVKAGALLDGIRAQQLKNIMNQIPFRVSKDSVNRIVGKGNVIIGKIKELEKRLQNIPRAALRNWKNYVETIKSGALMDGIKAQQLRYVMSQISVRTVKDSINRVRGNGNAILGKFKELEKRLQGIPRQALQNWRNYVEKIKSGALLDGIKAQQLRYIMNQIPFRISKDAVSRLMGNGNAILGKLKVLENRLQGIPRDALRNWKNYVDKIKAGALMDGLRAK